MAKKKKRRSRGGGPRGGGQRPQGATGPRSTGPGADADAAREQRRAAARERREAEQRRRQARRRAALIRNIGVAVAVAALIGAFAVYRVSQARSASKSFSKIAASAGCGKVESQKTSAEDRTHLAEGESVTYDTSPPTHGKHAPAPLPAGIYNEPFSTDAASNASTIYRAVHSLEHGYVIVWHKDLSEAQLKALEKQVKDARKVILVPYPDLKDGKIALTVWSKKMTCAKPDPKVVRAFVDRYREKTGPENAAP